MKPSKCVAHLEQQAKLASPLLILRVSEKEKWKTVEENKIKS